MGSANVGSKRRADREFLLSRGRTGKQEIRNVRAGDQQHQTDGAEQHQQHWPHLAHDHLA